MKLNLLPCPFCGGHAEYDTQQSFREFVSGKISKAMTVYCEKCTAEITVCIPDVPDITIEQVADAWNRRAPAHPEAGESRADHFRDATKLVGESRAEIEARALEEVAKHFTEFGDDFHDGDSVAHYLSQLAAEKRAGASDA